MMSYLLYNVLLLLASPFILIILLAKGRCRRGFSQRFGFTSPAIVRDQRPLVWIHAVSLGESVAVAPLVKELHRRHPDHRFVVSTVTETGREAVEQRLTGIAEHIYAPLDFPWVVSKLIGKLRPVLYVFVETELWPNILRKIHERGIPAVMVNGRISTGSFARQQWKPIRYVYRTMLHQLSLCLMQSERDVERIVSLGADPTAVRRVGNIKFDQPMPDQAGVRSLRTALRLADAERVFVAGSTHPGEEEAILEGYRRLVVRVPSAVLIVAPRHIERIAQLESVVRTSGFQVLRRSSMGEGGAAALSGPRVVLLDSRGELATVYSEAEVAYVGGTLVPVGGHNLLEPAAWGKPVLFGPHTDHCQEIATLLLEAGGGLRVADVEELSKRLIHLFEHQDARAEIGRKARQVVENNRGALRSTLEAIESLPVFDKTCEKPIRSGESLPLMAER